MKKILTAMLVTAILIPTVVFSLANSYTDLSAHWAEAYILPLSEQGIFQGYEDETFKPDNQITVAEFIKIVTVAVGEEIEPGEGADWYLPYQEAAEAERIIQTGDFEADDYNRPITRGEMARMIVRALKESPESGTTAFADEAELPYHLKGHIKSTYELGIMSGYPDGTFRANGSATRGEAARVITSMLNPDTRTLPVVIEGDHFRFENNILYYVDNDGNTMDTLTNSTFMTREEINWYFKTIYGFAEEHGLYFTLGFSEDSSYTSLWISPSKENFEDRNRSATFHISVTNNGNIPGMDELGKIISITTDNLTNQAQHLMKVDVEPYLGLTKKIMQYFTGDRYTEALYQDFETFQLNKSNYETIGPYYGPIPIDNHAVNGVRVSSGSAGGYRVNYSIYLK